MSLLPVFDKYFTRDDAEYYLSLFINNGLHPLVDTPKESFNAIFGNTQIDLQYVLRLPAEEFIEATNCIENEIRNKGVPADYYMHQLKDEELYEVIKIPENWSRQDVIVAKIILENRPINVDPIRLQKERSDFRYVQKNKKKINFFTLLLLYLFSLFSGLLALFTGLMVFFIKDTDIDGQKDFVFNNEIRRHGLVLAGIGFLSSIGWMIHFDLI